MRWCYTVAQQHVKAPQGTDEYQDGHDEGHNGIESHRRTLGATELFVDYFTVVGLTAAVAELALFHGFHYQMTKRPL